MPLITWGPQLETGFETVDKQHFRLVELINELNDAMHEKKSADVMGAVLKELVEYTHTHFRTEEAMLEKNEYEDYALHRREHKIFTDQIEIYQDRLDAGAMDMSTDVLEYLRGWLLTHIMVSDRAYIESMQEAGVE